MDTIIFQTVIVGYFGCYNNKLYNLTSERLFEHDLMPVVDSVNRQTY